MSIEVEHKFSLGPNAHTQLHAMGAVKKSSCTFSDTYYDVMDNKLMLGNHWLRCRDKQWQLKYPSIAHDGNDSNYTDTFNELDDHDEIMKHLTDVFGHFGGSMEQTMANLDSLVSCGVLVPVVNYTTTRDTWVIGKVEGHTDVRVDLDQTCFGYSVGEVEVVVDTVEEATKAEHIVREIAQKLGT